MYERVPPPPLRLSVGVERGGGNGEWAEARAVAAPNSLALNLGFGRAQSWEQLGARPAAQLKSIEIPMPELHPWRYLVNPAWSNG